MPASIIVDLVVDFCFLILPDAILAWSEKNDRAMYLCLLCATAALIVLSTLLFYSDGLSPAMSWVLVFISAFFAVASVLCLFLVRGFKKQEIHKS